MGNDSVGTVTNKIVRPEQHLGEKADCHWVPRCQLPERCRGSPCSGRGGKKGI